MSLAVPLDLHGTLHRMETAEQRRTAFEESAMGDDPALMGDAMQGASQEWWGRFAGSLTDAQRELLAERVSEYAWREFR